MGLSGSLGLLVFSCLVWSASSYYYSTKPRYTMLFSRSARAGSTLDIGVTLKFTSKPTYVRLELIDYNGHRLQEGQSYKLDGNGHHKITLKFSDELRRPKSTMYLHATGKGGVKFDRWDPLVWRNRKMTVFLQMDKRDYKPGDTVKMRALAMKMDTSVVKEAMTIVVRDSLHNMVAKYERADGASMVWKGELPLPMHMRTGWYYIRASVKGAAKVKYFRVTKYERPDFRLLVWVPQRTWKDKDVIVRVKGMYHVGTPLEASGTITVSSYRYYSYWWYRCRYFRTTSYVRRSFTLDGTGWHKEKIKMTDLQAYVCSYYNYYIYRYYRSLCYTPRYYIMYRHLKFDVALKDKNSYSRLRKIKYIRIADNKWFLRWAVPTSYYFKPGVRNNIYVQDVRRNGKPNKHNKSDHVNVTVTYYQSSRYCSYYYYYYRLRYMTKTTKQYTKLGLSWDLKTAHAAIDVPADACYMRVSASNGLMTISRFFRRFYSVSGTYAHIELNNDAKFNATRRLLVQSNKEFQNFVVMAFSKGDMIMSERVTKSSKVTSATYQFTISKKFTPVFNMVVLIDENHKYAEIVGDGIREDVTFHEYELKLTLSGQRLKTEKPGADVNITIDTSKNTDVFLLGRLEEDQTQANNIDYDDLTNALRAHDVGKFYSNYFYHYSYSLFYLMKYSGLSILTNGYLRGYYMPYYALPRTYRWWYYSWYRGFRYRYYWSCSRYAPTPSPPPKHTRVPRFPRRGIVKYVEDTWLFAHTSVGADSGTVVMKIDGAMPKAPDTLSNYVVSGFAVNEEKGFTTAINTTMLTTAKKIMTTNYGATKVKRTEVPCFKMLAHNTDEKDHNLTVKITKSEGKKFTIVRVKSGTEETEEHIHHTTSEGILKQTTMKSTPFCVKPQVLGKIPIRFVAKGDEGQDDLTTELIVEPEGIPRSNRVQVKHMLVSKKLTRTETFKNISISLPSNVVANSHQVKVIMAGHPLAVTLHNLDNLLHMPYSNAEQNLARFSVAVSLATFIEKSKHGNDSLSEKVKTVMQKAYHTQMVFQRYDGCFSMFGNRDRGKPSTWLTAYTLRTMMRANALKTKLINIEPDILRRAVGCLTEKQEHDGSFSEAGRRIHPYIQVNSDAGTRRLTAWVTMALESAKKLDKNEHVVALRRVNKAYDAAVEYLKPLHNSTIVGTLTPYTQAIVGAALRGYNKKAMVNFPVEVKPTVKKYLAKKSTDPMEIEVVMFYSASRKNVKAEFQYFSDNMNEYGGFMGSFATSLGVEAMTLKDQKYKFDESAEVEVSLTKADGTLYTIKRTVSGMDIHVVDADWKDSDKLMTATVKSTATVTNAQDRVITFTMIKTGYTVDAAESKGSISVSYAGTYSYSENMFYMGVCVKKSSYNRNYDNMLTYQIFIPSGYKLALDFCRYNNYFSHFHYDREKQVLTAYFYESQLRTYHRCTYLRFKRHREVAHSEDIYIRMQNTMNPANEFAEKRVGITNYGVCKLLEYNYDSCTRGGQ